MSKEGRKDAYLMKHPANPLFECLAAVDTPDGRRRMAEYLKSQPFPHYEASPDAPDLLVRIEEDGTRTIGRFVNRRFEAGK